MQRGRPEKIGDRPSQTDAPPSREKNDSSLSSGIFILCINLIILITNCQGYSIKKCEVEGDPPPLETWPPLPLFSHVTDPLAPSFFLVLNPHTPSFFNDKPLFFSKTPSLYILDLSNTHRTTFKNLFFIVRGGLPLRHFLMEYPLESWYPCAYDIKCLSAIIKSCFYINMYFHYQILSYYCLCTIGSCEWNGLLYVVGGYDGASCLASVERYDPLTRTWTSVAAMNLRRRYLKVTVLGMTFKRNEISCVIH